MNNVIQFPGPPEPASLQGSATCLQCKHKWEAVAPVGTTQLECPACQTLKGVFFLPVGRGEQVYSCKCGCEMFRISEAEIFCPVCGDYQFPF